MTAPLSSLSTLATEHARITREIREHIAAARTLSDQKAQIELHAAIAGVALDGQGRPSEVGS